MSGVKYRCECRVLDCLQSKKYKRILRFVSGEGELVAKPAKIGGLDVAFIMPGADVCFVGNDSIELIVA